MVRSEYPATLEAESLCDVFSMPHSGDIPSTSLRNLQRVPLDLVNKDADFLRDAAEALAASTYMKVRRGLDILGAVTLGLPVLPLLPLVDLAIRLDSAGPAIYRQTRLGMGNAPFSICKFRTMRQDAEANGAVYASTNDPRITRLGSFLRRTRIDEIPQLWNILRGDMSFIGPRPERPENLAMLEAAIPGFSLRTTIRPGLTGWAQVSSINYAATVEETGRKVERDFHYLLFAGPWLDLQIAVRTIMVVLRFRGR